MSRARWRPIGGCCFLRARYPCRGVPRQVISTSNATFRATRVSRFASSLLSALREKALEVIRICLSLIKRNRHFAAGRRRILKASSRYAPQPPPRDPSFSRHPFVPSGLDFPARARDSLSSKHSRRGWRERRGQRAPER